MSRLPHGTTKIFTEVWEDVEEFRQDYEESGIYANVANRLDDDHVSLLYYLLYARYGNSSIANLDENQFKYKVFTVIFQYGPTWVRKLDIQSSLRALTETDIIQGSKAVNAHAYAMGDDGINATDDPTKIDQKTSVTYSKSKLEGYATLVELLETDVTGQFLDRFKPLFAKFIYTKPDLFITIEEEEEDDD